MRDTNGLPASRTRLLDKRHNLFLQFKRQLQPSFAGHPIFGMTLQAGVGTRFLVKFSDRDSAPNAGEPP